jgi:hypothetical protein
MDKARFFGECPQFAFNGATSLIKVGATTTSQVAPAKGVASITILADTVFAALVLAFPITGSADLAGVTIPAGTTIYGVQQYQVTSGTGIAYHSHA